MLHSATFHLNICSNPLYSILTQLAVFLSSLTQADHQQTPSVACINHAFGCYLNISCNIHSYSVLQGWYNWEAHES